ncbi:putative protein phosphatase 2c protein [Lasiodiplodia theobromae]|nr:putative protein phosphatase 2c protein [Lasiodiplodia theobromae]
MPLNNQSLKKILGAVSSRSPTLSRRLCFPRPPSTVRYARVSPVATIVGGAAAVTGAAAYLLQPTAFKEENAAIFVPQISSLKKDGGSSNIQSPVRALNLADANEVLRREQSSKLFDAGNGQRGRCDVVRVPSNSPVEDEFVVGTQVGPGRSQWTFWGVFDGHAGWATSVLLRENLISMVSDHLEELPANAPSPEISSAIIKAFISVDDSINAAALAAMNGPDAQPGSAEVLSAIAPAIAGSCALLAAYDPRSTTLRVACTGDSRAVLGRVDADSAKPKYTAVPLSKDQTGKNDDEYARLTAAHPGEEETMINRESGRILGLAVTRAFGDHRWKWRESDITEAQQRYWSSGPRPNSRTPPYLTAEPVIEETRINVGVKAGSTSTGGDAVECVARWIAAKKANNLRGTPPSLLKDKAPKRNEHWWLDEGRYVEWRATPEYFVVEDDNAATHLVRNAFGGSRRNLFCGVMSAYPPISRNVRDDTTVQVVFFGDV